MDRINGKIRIAVAHSREIGREALAALLSTQPGFGVEARVGYGNDLLEQVRRTSPDILLLERDQATGIWLSRLRAAAGDPKPPKSILLSDSVCQDSVVEAIEWGLRGIIAHDAPAAMLFKGIRCVHAGEYWLGRERVGDMMAYLQNRKNGGIAGRADNQFGLTTRERDVIAGLLTGSTNKEIAQTLRISSQAVRHHLCNIFEKVGVSNRLELALFAIRHGLGHPEV